MTAPDALVWGKLQETTDLKTTTTKKRLGSIQQPKVNVISHPFIFIPQDQTMFIPLLTVNCFKGNVIKIKTLLPRGSGAAQRLEVPWLISDSQS